MKEISITEENWPGKYGMYGWLWITGCALFADLQQLNWNGLDIQIYLHATCLFRACFLSLVRSKLRLWSANHRACYFSNLACDWLSIVWAYSEKGTENRPISNPGTYFIDNFFTHKLNPFERWNLLLIIFFPSVCYKCSTSHMLSNNTWHVQNFVTNHFI